MGDGQGEGWCSVERGDVSVLIGLCAALEGHLHAEREELAYLRRHLGARLVVDGASAGRMSVGPAGRERPEPPVAVRVGGVPRGCRSRFR